MFNESKLEKEIEHAKKTAHHNADEALKKAKEYHHNAQKKMVEANEQIANAEEKFKENLTYKETELKLNVIEEQIKDNKNLHDHECETLGDKVKCAFHDVKDKLVRRNSNPHDQVASPQQHHQHVVPIPMNLA